MFIEKGGCGSSHGGAQAVLPINMDIPRRLMQKDSAPSDTTKSTSLDIILGTKRTFVFNDDLSLSLVQNEFGVLALKMTNNTGFYGSCCNVNLGTVPTDRVEVETQGNGNT